jgi:hypothetical protein
MDAIYSPFCNTYGGLDLHYINGVPVLRMGDCIGNDYFGPLTAEQVEAFHTLCGVTPLSTILDLEAEGVDEDV